MLTSNFQYFTGHSQHVTEAKSAISQMYQLLSVILFDWFSEKQNKGHHTERERESVCRCVCVCAQVCVCSRQGKELGVASTALEVVWTAVYLTGYSNYPTGLHESLLLPYTIDVTPV